jgi:peptidoglycan/xylan/chitin deacetylase (PgdA/CDA1 family)
MKYWKRALLGTYYYGSLPWRRRQNARLGAAGQAPAIVLTYHRVSDDYSNGWTIRPREFAEQMNWLRWNYELVSLEEAQRRIRARSNDRACVAITFDDGYAENCRMALPMLIALRIPCTYFVCTDNVVRGVPFPHDVEQGFSCAPNTVEQLRAIARAGIAIGAHTRTHANLGGIHDPVRLRDEVIVAGEELQDVVGMPVRYFAFPFGQHSNLNPAAFQLAYEAGYDGVCSAYGGYNIPGDDPFHLQRFCVDGPSIRMKNAVTIDPLKQWQTRRFFYGPEVSPRQPVGVAQQ